MKTSMRVAFTLGLGILSSALPIAPTIAQPDPSGLVPPRRVTDARGVDLANGDMSLNIPATGFGQYAPPLSVSFQVMVTNPSGMASTDFQNRAGYIMAQSLRPQAYTAGGFYTDDYGTYNNVVFPTGSGYYQFFRNIHTNSDGSQYRNSFGPSHFTLFTSTNPALAGTYDAQGNKGIPGQPSYTAELYDKIVFANGEEWHFYRQYVNVPCAPLYGCTTMPLARTRSIVSSRGYAIQILYVSNNTPSSNIAAGSWYAPNRITAYNKAYIFCDESLLQECASVSSLPSAEIVYNGTAGTIAIREPGSTEGVELTLAHIGSQWAHVSSYRHTGVANSAVSFQLGTDNLGTSIIQRLTDSDGHWDYTRIVNVDDSGHVPTMSATSTNPSNGVNQVTGYAEFGQIEAFTDELNRSYQYGSGFPFRDGYRMEPEGDSTEVARDERNNITSIVRQPNYSSGAPPITIFQASYPTDCTNPRTCNRPTWVKDGNLNQTDYTYAPEHGGVLTETGPAVPTRQTNGTMANVRPQKRYEYAQRTAWTSNGSGGYVAGPPMWLLTRERYCRTTAASGSTCTGGANDEVVTDYDYGPNSGPNNLLLRGMAVTAHDGTQITTLRTCYGYDANGNRISQTQPNANLTSCP